MMERIVFDRESEAVAVDVVFEHRGKVMNLKMAVDTGSSLVRIPMECVETLGLDIEVDRTVKTLTASGMQESPFVKVPNIRLGSSEARGVGAIVNDLPVESRVDGLLGLSFLKNFNLYIDFGEGYLEFAS